MRMRVLHHQRRPRLEHLTQDACVQGGTGAYVRRDLDALSTQSVCEFLQLRFIHVQLGRSMRRMTDKELDARVEGECQPPRAHESRVVSRGGIDHDQNVAGLFHEFL
jgi:hypothetical protein